MHGIPALEQTAVSNKLALESPRKEHKCGNGPAFNSHYRECPSTATYSRGITHKRKAVGYISELEAMEEMQALAVGMGSINLWTHGFPW